MQDNESQRAAASVVPLLNLFSGPTEPLHQLDVPDIATDIPLRYNNVTVH